MPATGEQAAATFSEMVKAASWDAHEHAEQSRFMQELLAGSLPIERYADLVAQQLFAYRVLEEGSLVMAGDPTGSRFVFPELFRLPALEQDLTALLGPDWSGRTSPTAATQEYCDRLRAVCFDWPGGYVAHHYVRYMGDLSGGQVIRRVLERHYGIDRDTGTAFYAFDAVDDLKELKARYRELLDSQPWPIDERERIVDEVLTAYRLNSEVLDSLG
jgi:heme oxygenase